MISRRTRSGRITVMLAFLMTGTTVYLGLSLNLSRLLQERAHMQITADAAAWSAAVQQCRGLNRIARMNTEAVTVLKRTSLALKCYIFPNHDAGSRAALVAEWGYKAYNYINLAKQEQVNIEARDNARDTARQIVRLNAPDTTLDSYTPCASAMGRLIPAGGTRERFGYFFKQATPWGEVVLYDPGKVIEARILRKALPRDTIFYTARISKPFTSWLFDWGGSGGVCDLRAYATAKPGAGSLWDGKAAHPSYLPGLVRTGSVFPAPSIPDDWGYEW